MFKPESGFWECLLPSEYQAGPSHVQVLLPDHLDARKKYPVLYILPVEEGAGTRYGSGLAEAKKADVANEYGVICVYPSFLKAVPWYGNHATDPQLRQGDCVVRTLVPFIDGKYPTRRDKENRWLLGFSKSGWGAYTLLFRHPAVFGYAAAWDAPFMFNGDNSGKDWGPIGLSVNFGTKEAMQQCLPTKLAVENAPWLKQRCRLVLGVGEDWQDSCVQMHGLLEEQAIPHIYRPNLLVVHRWDTGWFPQIMEELVKAARTPSS